PLTEEPGWRGFALPRLQQRWSPLVGSIILGLLWAAWHLPNYFRPDWSTVNGGVSFSGIAVFAAATVVFSVVLTWVYNRTGGSILMAILVHASINFSQGLTGDLFPAAKNNEVAPVIGFAVLAVVAFIGAVAFSLVGALIVSQHPRHAIGWIFTLSGAATAGAVVLAAYAELALAPGWSLPAASFADSVSHVLIQSGIFLPLTLG